MMDSMAFLMFLIFAGISSICANQFYDPSDCSSQTDYPGSRYTCNSVPGSCQTYVVYRASISYPNISSISRLFGLDSDQLALLNNVSARMQLKPGRDVLVPVRCYCSGQFFQANVNYSISENTSFSETACGVFEGLSKANTLHTENVSSEGDIDSHFHVPLKCACPDNSTSLDGIKYLITYPFIEGDGPKNLAAKFGISIGDLSEANSLVSFPTVYPKTTILVPLKKKPSINFSISDSQPPTPAFLPTSVGKPNKKLNLRILYIAGSVIGFSLVVLILTCVIYYCKSLNKSKHERFQSSAGSPLSCSTPRSSHKSSTPARNSLCLSPDLLGGVKFSMYNYNMEELKQATRNFSEDIKLGDQTYKGLLENSNVEVMIRQMRFDDTRHVIDAHSKINHINVVKLHGVCYGQSDSSWSYLVFEFPSNGCLRDWLSNSFSPLRWQKRTQLAFDIATGLNYLHYCTFPSYNRLSITSRYIFITTNWRAKLVMFEAEPAGAEYVKQNTVLDKLDIFAYGMVLLELVSGKEQEYSESFRESIGFLGGGANEVGCLEQLRNFMDPAMKGDYALTEALCLAVLAKACVEEDPMHRPSMDDIMKVLARMADPFSSKLSNHL